MGMETTPDAVIAPDAKVFSFDEFVEALENVSCADLEPFDQLIAELRSMLLNDIRAKPTLHIEHKHAE